jgi:uncharacterized protein YidB (DUF937 family)
MLAFKTMKGEGPLGGLFGNRPAQGTAPQLLKCFEQSGLGNAAESWVSSGPNQPVSPNDFEKAAGGDI